MSFEPNAKAENVAGPAAVPSDARALVGVDLGAESCRVSLLRWTHGRPEMELVHRFANGPVRAGDGSLRWPLDAIVGGVETGLRACAERAPEGIRSVAVDGWAVDYVRLGHAGEPLAAPFCYRDERILAAEARLHERIPAERLRAITGLQLQSLNTLYQLFADRLAGAPAGKCWLNLPEYLLARWGGEPVAEYTNATHTQMVELEGRCWSREILNAAGLDPATMPTLVPSGTLLGKMTGEMAQMAAFRDAELIAPACHDTASAVAGIPAHGDDWGYISSGTWSLVGTRVEAPCNGPLARAEQFTNLGAVGNRMLLQKNVNGMWLLKQCMDAWAEAGGAWEIGELVAASERAEVAAGLLEVDDPELMGVGDMPGRINAQRRRNGDPVLDASAAGAPVMAALIFRSLAARYAALFRQLEELANRELARIFVVGGGSRNAFLRRLTEEATGKRVFAGSAESSTLGNFAVQLAALDHAGLAGHESLRSSVAGWAERLATVYGGWSVCVPERMAASQDV